nr:MAG TPA: NTP-PPase-like protein [Caudoviricetes sp.]
MKNAWDSVAAFMEAGGQTIGQQDSSIEEVGSYFLRVDEEVDEIWYAIKAARQSKVEIADGYADTIYAAMTGLLNLVGRDKAEAIFQAVVDANSSKVDGSLGPVRRAENGKILKPAGFVPPNQTIKKILEG